MTARCSTLLLSALLLGATFLAACGEDPAPTPPPSPEPVAEPEPPAAPAAPTPVAPEDPNEACARVIVVAWAGATAAPPTVTRTEEEARARAEELLTRLNGGADMAELARTESDAASSGPRGGLLGTYMRDEFPEIHAPIRDPLFALQVHQTSEVLRAPYGFVIARRCPVEKVTTRHILVRYAGAPNAPDTVTRTQAEARTLAEQIRAEVLAPGADFAAIARTRSEDGSSEQGGLIGSVGRGLLQPPYEEAAFALEVGAISPVVETRYGYHIIQRVADEAPSAP